MTRPIKFQVWDKIRKQLAFQFEKKIIAEDGTEFSVIAFVFSGEDTWSKKLVTLGDAIAHPNRFVVMQFTGLLDKNGKEIYEGYIVETGIYDLCTVIWPEKYVTGDNEDIMAWCIDPLDPVKYQGIHGLDIQNGYEIIGNIYENAELLK